MNYALESVKDVQEIATKRKNKVTVVVLGNVVGTGKAASIAASDNDYVPLAGPLEIACLRLCGPDNQKEIMIPPERNATNTELKTALRTLKRGVPIEGDLPTAWNLHTNNQKDCQFHQ